jgi:RNA polymerase sigma-70 factor (ECF subfamily)
MAAADAVLLEAARRDAEAFGELYRRHLGRVYGYLLARVGDVATAEDLTAQTFLAALEGLAGYAGRGDVAGWLVGIARHKAMDHFRRGDRTVSLAAAAQVVAPGPAPEDEAALGLRRERLARALAALAPERAEALSLRVFGGLSTAEVGRIMGKSEAAVKMLVHRAVHDLQQRLGEGVPQEEGA